MIKFFNVFKNLECFRIFIIYIRIRIRMDYVLESKIKYSVKKQKFFNKNI